LFHTNCIFEATETIETIAETETIATTEATVAEATLNFVYLCALES